MINFTPDKCECCEQTTTYALAIDKGSVKIVKQIAKFIEKKGINIVHPRKELEGNGLSSNEVGNLSRPRFHGLIAKVNGRPGNYCMTRKGSNFLNGAVVPRVAIISKAEGKQIGYFKPSEVQCIVENFYTGEYWEGINYDIREGQVIKRVEQLKDKNLFNYERNKI